MKLPYTKKVSVAAHRGFSARFAENTREAFAAAVKSNCDMIETDIRLTKDNVLILMHDSTVDRTTDGTGAIADFTYEELCKFNCNPKGEFSEIPTLEEFMKLAVENDMMVNLEIKEYNLHDNGDRCRLCIEKTLEVVEKYDWVGKTIINSFDAYVLEYTDSYMDFSINMTTSNPNDKIFLLREYTICGYLQLDNGEVIYTTAMNDMLANAMAREAETL